jgi:rod shape-determining protein MreD
LLAIVAQATLVHALAIRSVVPSFVLVVVVWYAIRVDARRAAVYGLVAGLCEDALSAGTGAAWMISTCSSAVVASMLSRGFFSDSIPLVGAITVFVTLLARTDFLGRHGVGRISRRGSDRCICVKRSSNLAQRRGRRRRHARRAPFRGTAAMMQRRDLRGTAWRLPTWRLRPSRRSSRSRWRRW